MSSGKHYSSRREKRRRLKKNVVVLLIAAAAVIVLTAGLNHWQNSRHTQVQQQSTVSAAPVIRKPQEMEVNGVKYIQRTDLQVYLFMGIDSEGDISEEGASRSRDSVGQADVQMVLVFDDQAKTWQILQLNRDMMVDIDVPGVTGKTVETRYEQLALSHTYGNDEQQRAETTLNTVSRFLNNEPFNGYVAINMDAVGKIVDQMGGVTITIEDDWSNVRDDWKIGDTVTLTGDDALQYVRQRWNIGNEVNDSRMRRQRHFMEAFMNQFSSLPDSRINELYESISDNTESNMRNQQVTNIARRTKDYEEKAVVTIKGDYRQNEETDYMEFYPSEADVNDTIVSLFYRQED